MLFLSHTYDPQFKSVGSSQKDKAAEKAQMILKVLNNLQRIEPERGGNEGKGIYKRRDLNFFFIASVRQNLFDVFSCSCLLECCLSTISRHDLFFVCLLGLPLFLNRSACDKINADGFTFNHSKQKKNINHRGMLGAPCPKNIS